MRCVTATFLLFATTAWAEVRTVPVTADVGICAHPKEVSLNTGGNSHIRVKGNEHYYLFDFDREPIRGWRVTKATLRLKQARGNLRRVAFCTVPCPWVEGTAINKPQVGSTCFTHVKYATNVWPRGGQTEAPRSDLHHLGGTMLEATFNNPAMAWRASDVRRDKKGWLEIPIDPELVQACLDGRSFGLVMSDEKGQTRENHDIHTREQRAFRPVLIVEGAPGPVSSKPSEPARVGPATPRNNESPLPKADRPRSSGGGIPTPRGAWVSIAVDARSGEEAFRVVTPDGLASIPYVVLSVKKDGQWVPEVCVPTRDGVFPTGEAYTASTPRALVDLWVPADARPGRHRGEIVLLRDDEVVRKIPFELDVSDIALPDDFPVAGDMNTYSSPARAMGVRAGDAEAFLAMERKYYRLAHQHRMTLNVLPYSQSGTINWRGAPRLGVGGRLEFGDWDRRYGPLLDGSAFDEKTGYVGPGRGVPIRHMYLPFHENWPAALEKSFKPWPPPRNFDPFLKWQAELPPIGRCIQPPLRQAWIDGLRDFAKHLAEKGYDRTVYQVYLNDKYSFREAHDDGSPGRGISLWLLDEPMHTDDFLALAYFGRLVKQADPKGADIRYRIDISRPAYQRDLLDGAVDLNVCGGQLYDQRHLIARRKRLFGEEYWNYRMPPSFTASNLPWTLWPIRSLLWGATGTLPWQTIASDGDFDRADDTALMYPGRRLGVDGPVPSLRMKAWRDGLQIATLLDMLRKKRGWNDDQLRAWVGQVLGLDGWQDRLDPAPDAGIVTLKGVANKELQILTRAALTELGR